MNTYQLTSAQRFNRTIFGSALIIFTMLVNTAPLGLLALIPLFATYPIFTAIYGYDLVSGYLAKEAKVLMRVMQNFHGHKPHHG